MYHALTCCELLPSSLFSWQCISFRCCFPALNTTICQVPDTAIQTFAVNLIILQATMAHAAPVVVAARMSLKAMIGVACRFLVLVVNHRVLEFVSCHF